MVTTTYGTTKIQFTSLYTWVHKEMMQCISLKFDAEMFASYMQQWIELSTLKAIISCETYNNILRKHYGLSKKPLLVRQQSLGQQTF